MTKREKLLARAHQAPNNLTLDEFETLLKQCGWVFKRQKGSHRVWLSPSNRALPIQSDGGKATYIDEGLPVPVAPARKSYSGAFNVRVDRSLHRALAIEAARQGISLNAIVAKKLSETTCSV